MFVILYIRYVRHVGKFIYSNVILIRGYYDV